MERSTTRRLFSAREKGIIIRSIQKSSGSHDGNQSIGSRTVWAGKRENPSPGQDKDSFLTIIPCQDRLLPLLRLVGTDVLFILIVVGERKGIAHSRYDPNAFDLSITEQAAMKPITHKEGEARKEKSLPRSFRGKESLNLHQIELELSFELHLVQQVP